MAIWKAASSAGSPVPCTASCTPACTSAGNAASTRSRPFCEVRRLTTVSNKAPSSSSQAQLGLQGTPAGVLACRALGIVELGKGRVGGGVPDRVVDAVEHPRDRLAAATDDAVQPAAELVVAISRA